MTTAFATFGLLSLAAPAFAQDLDEEEAADASEEKKKARRYDDEVVREVVRGLYMKADIGSAALRPFSAVPMSGVMDVALGIGMDFIDQERFSMAWEIQAGQSLFNGPPTEALPAPVVQGDVHAIRGIAVVEASGYLSRRFGIGGRAGGGVMDLPLLITPEANAEITGAFGQPLLMHQGPLPLAVVGVTFEYYTKLSHFSLGMDNDLQIIIPAALGGNFEGFLKYTF